jgi:hypothetical protein
MDEAEESRNSGLAPGEKWAKCVSSGDKNRNSDEDFNWTTGYVDQSQRR